VTGEAGRVGVDVLLFVAACMLVARARGAPVRRRARRLTTPGGGPRRADRFEARTRAALRHRGIGADPGQVAGGWALAIVAAASVGSVLGPAWTAAGAIAVIASGPLSWRACGARADRSRAAAVPEALAQVARDLRSGSTVELALARQASGTGPLAVDLQRVRARSALLGWPDALRGWAHEPGGPRVPASLPVAASGLAVAAEVGGPAADALDALAGGLRHEHERLLEARALSTQGRLSAVVVAAAPVGSVLLASALDPGTAGVLLTTGAGRVCLACGLLLEGLAAWWMRRILVGVTR
jgi:Flp pilus assembly protein TadB